MLRRYGKAFGMQAVRSDFGLSLLTASRSFDGAVSIQSDNPEITARDESLSIVRTLRAAGFTAYWAGGCVRDQLMGRAPKDYDVATNATPEEVQRLFPHTLDVGRKFGVIHVVFGSRTHEVATFRRDSPQGDGRRPESVEFSDPQQDALRRDFTINGLFFDPEENRLIDYVGGEADLQRRISRAIGRPVERFAEDRLRLLRAVRFASTLDFAIDPETEAAICTLSGTIVDVSAERIQQELTRLLTESPRAGRGLRLLHSTGLLAVLLPEVERLHGQEQPPQFHPEGDVFEHTALMLDAMAPGQIVLAWAVLLHDIGKPPTAAITQEPDGSMRIRFNGHASVGADMAKAILRRLRMSNRLVDDVSHCVRNHMRFSDVQQMRPSTLRRLVGAPTFPVELELHRLDCLASHRNLDNYTFLLASLQKIKNEPILPARWISGADLFAMGLSEGPAMGRWLHYAYEQQLDGQIGSREDLLAQLREDFKRSSEPPSP